MLIRNALVLSLAAAASAAHAVIVASGSTQTALTLSLGRNVSLTSFTPGLDASVRIELPQTPGVVAHSESADVKRDGLVFDFSGDASFSLDTAGNKLVHENALAVSVFEFKNTGPTNGAVTFSTQTTAHLDYRIDRAYNGYRGELFDGSVGFFAYDQADNFRTTIVGGGKYLLSDSANLTGTYDETFSRTGTAIVRANSTMRIVFHHGPTFGGANFAPVPEPGTYAALGLGAVAFLRRRKRA